jgi:hypothetical protein
MSRFDFRTRTGQISPIIQGQTLVTTLLDIYPNSTASYSLRFLRNDYAGSAIRVRRSSDNTEQDIGFDSVGNLNTTALLTFTGSSSGFVTTWYDQSGNSNNLTQSTAVNQPQIVNLGSVNTQGTKPCVKFDGNDYMLNATNGVVRLDQRTHFIVARELTSVNFAGIISYSPLTGDDFGNTNAGNINAGNGSGFGNTSVNLGINVLTITGTKPMPYRLISLYGDATTGYVQANNGTFVSILHSYSLNQFQTGKIHLGVRFLSSSPDTAFAFNGVMQEIVMYNGSTQNANIAAINNNINTYYGIY